MEKTLWLAFSTTLVLFILLILSLSYKIFKKSQRIEQLKDRIYEEAVSGDHNLIPSYQAEIFLLKRRLSGYQKECEEVLQVLGRALKYLKDSGGESICTGDHTPGTLAKEAAEKITEKQAAYPPGVDMREIMDRIHSQREKILEAFIAETGCKPSECEQVFQNLGEGANSAGPFFRWYVRKKEDDKE